MNALKPRNSSPWLWACLIVALLWAQSLGLIHQALHAPGLAAVASEMGAQTVLQKAPTCHKEASGFWAHLWGDAQTADCLSYDQLAQGHGFTSPLMVASFALPAWVDRPVLLDARRVNPALFDARGPPTLL